MPESIPYHHLKFIVTLSSHLSLCLWFQLLILKLTFLERQHCKVLINIKFTLAEECIWFVAYTTGFWVSFIQADAPAHAGKVSSSQCHGIAHDLTNSTYSTRMTIQFFHKTLRHNTVPALYNRIQAEVPLRNVSILFHGRSFEDGEGKLLPL
jgi:hypothetical protein